MNSKYFVLKVQNKCNSKPVFISRKYIYVKNTFKTAMFYIYIVLADHSLKEQKKKKNTETGDSR